MEKCSYGCNGIGIYKKIGRKKVVKWSCSDNIQHCPAMKEKSSKKGKEITDKLKKDGRYEDITKKILKTKMVVDKNGENSFDRATKKMVKTRKENGSYATGARKGADTKLNTIDTETGLSLAKVYGIKAYNTRKNTIDAASGLTIQELCISKGIKTRHTIGPDGLSSYDKGQIKAKKLKPYKQTTLYYGSSYEEKWLMEIEELMGIDWLLLNIKRGPVIMYNDPINTNKTRQYPADFIFEDILIEIKSSYIWNKTPEDKSRNIAKMDKALKLGFDVRLIYDFKEYIWKRDRHLFL